MLKFALQFAVPRIVLFVLPFLFIFLVSLSAYADCSEAGLNKEFCLRIVSVFRNEPIPVAGIWRHDFDAFVRGWNLNDCGHDFFKHCEAFRDFKSGNGCKSFNPNTNDLNEIHGLIICQALLYGNQGGNCHQLVIHATANLRIEPSEMRTICRGLQLATGIQTQSSTPWIEELKSSIGSLSSAVEKYINVNNLKLMVKNVSSVLEYLTLPEQGSHLCSEAKLIFDQAQRYALRYGYEDLDFIQGVRYLEAGGRIEFEAKVVAGKIQDSTGNLINGGFLYVFGNNGNFYLIPQRLDGRLYHSSVPAGGNVLAAGELKANDGEIMEINNQSGHYRPDLGSIYDFISYLKALGYESRISPHIHQDALW